MATVGQTCPAADVIEREQANSFWEPIVSKATEQNDKLKRAIIISVALHIILIALLIWSSFDEHLDASAGGGGGSSIDAVMVDPGGGGK